MAVTDTDSFLSINQASFLVDATPNILATASQQQLYDMSVQNGLNLSYSQFGSKPIVASYSTNTFFGGVGSPLCLYFGKDIIWSDSATSAPGLNTKVNFGVTLTITNQSTITTTVSNQYAIFYLLVFDGVCQIQRGSVAYFTGILAKEDILNAMQRPSVDFGSVVHYSGRGFSFSNLWDKLVNWKNKLTSSELYKKVAPIVKSELGPLGALATDLGFGKKRYHKRY